MVKKLTVSWSQRTSHRFPSGAKFLSLPINSSSNWAADNIYLKSGS
uniref:Uncharacterized protein n=1 Tax=Anguilla anguilla TaxID=7936 RepID=A0A0E9PDS3_ANGAN